MAELETDFPHLNPDDPTKDIWRIPKEDLQGDRPPGLIDLQRYPLGLGPCDAKDGHHREALPGARDHRSRTDLIRPQAKIGRQELIRGTRPAQGPGPTG